MTARRKQRVWRYGRPPNAGRYLIVLAGDVHAIGHWHRGDWWNDTRVPWTVHGCVLAYMALPDLPTPGTQDPELE